MLLDETPTPCEAPERGSAVSQEAHFQQDVTAPVPPACTEQLLGPRGGCAGHRAAQVSRSLGDPGPRVGETNKTLQAHVGLPQTGLVLYTREDTGGHTPSVGVGGTPSGKGHLS